LFGDEAEIANEIKKRIKERTKQTASVGVARNKLVAKIASDLDKPDGLVVVTPENLRETLDPLPVQVIPGIGKETLARLQRFRFEVGPGPAPGCRLWPFRQSNPGTGRRHGQSTCGHIKA